jgi:hypothetical protein
MDPSNIDPHLAYLIPVAVIMGLVFAVIFIIPVWQICKKAGFTPWLCLLILIPFGALILLYVLAFSRWKVAPVPQYAGGYPPAIYPPPAYPATTYPPSAYPAAAPPPANPGDPTLPR